MIKNCFKSISLDAVSPSKLKLKARMYKLKLVTARIFRCLSAVTVVVQAKLRFYSLRAISVRKGLKKMPANGVKPQISVW